MKRLMNKNILIHGFILITILATAKSAEAEVTMEAAFQGHCGHTSPCEQLCYEIHDGMYECDCIEGYELNKNGYSCQVINATSNGDLHSKSDEDVLYQKGASFSAKLANDDESGGVESEDNENQLVDSNSNRQNIQFEMRQNHLQNLAIMSSSLSTSMEDDSVMVVNGGNYEELEQNHDGREQDFKVNSNDYYISDEDSLHLESFKFAAPSASVDSLPNIYESKPTASPAGETITKYYTATMSPPMKPLPVVLNGKIKALKTNIRVPTTISTTTKNPSNRNNSNRQQSTEEVQSQQSEQQSESSNNMNSNEAISSNNMEVDYYARHEDMSVYDDVNNNQLNLHPINRNTYQTQYISRKEDISSISTTAPSTATILNMWQLKEFNENNFKKNKMYDNYIESPTVSNISIISSSNILESISCSLDCGSEGLCDISDGTRRCLCPFGKTGMNCLEDTKIRIPKFTKNSWIAFPAFRGAYKHIQIRIEFRPESFDGIILLSGERDDLTGDFIALLLNKGFVEFWFDCGSGVGHVRSRETILLNEWNSIIIYRHRWDAWLVLNHGSKVQGRSNGLFSRITFREPVFLGGTGNITGLAKRLPVYSGFSGCIRSFVGNEHQYKFEEHPIGDVTKGFDIQDCMTDKCFKYPCKHGGKCLPSEGGAMCLCPIGFVGDLCEIRMDLQVPAFNGSSYLQYAPLGDTALIWLELKVIIKPEHTDGIILYSGPKKHGDFIALTLNNGFIEFSFDLGSGAATLRSERPLLIGQWHTVKVSRTARLAVLKVDSLPEVMTISSSGFWHLSLPHNLFVGGVSHADKLPLDLSNKAFFVGCIQKIEINGHSLAIISEALGGTNIGNCPHACVARPCGPLAECIPQMESYECRCSSAYNEQCNKEAEVSLDELRMHEALKKNKMLENSDEKLQLTNTPKLQIKLEQNAENIDKKKKPTVHHLLKEKQHQQQSKDHNGFKGSLFHKKMKKAKSVHGGEDKFGSERVLPTNPAITTTHTAHPGSFDKVRDNGEISINSEIVNSNDDFVFSDIEEMHKKVDQIQKDPENMYEKPEEESDSKDRVFSFETLTNKYKPKPTQHFRSHKRSHTSGSNTKKPYHEKYPTIGHKLSRLPTHYESFQTNPDSDILTFDENIDWEAQLAAESDEATQHDESMDEKHEERETHFNSPPKPDPFVIDETLFDAGTEEYQRKQLAQDMERIMTNEHTRQPQKKFKEEFYDYDYKSFEEQSIKDPIIGSTNQQDELQKPIEGKVTTSYYQKDLPDTKFSAHTTPQTQTDWSLLKKFDLDTKHSSVVGVRKNFGACFSGTDSYFHYSDGETMSRVISCDIDLNLRIKTHTANGVLLWTGRQSSSAEDDDYLSLGLEDGYLHFRYDLGSGEIDIVFNVTKLSDGLWHRIRAIRNSREGYIEVDGRKTAILQSPGHLRQLNTDTGLYVGGLPDVYFFTRRRYKNGIVGCISEIIVGGELKLNFDPNTLGTSHNVETGIL